MRLGIKSVFSIVIPYLFFVLFLFVFLLERQYRFTIAATLIITLLVIGFFTFNVFFIDENKIVVKHLLNPFKSNLKILYKDIERVTITRNTMRGSSTIIKIFVKHKLTPIKVSSCILKGEENVLVDVLTKNNVEVDRIFV